MGVLGLGCGIIISALTTKYRDMQFLVGFGVQLLMYGTPVIYGLSGVPDRLSALGGGESHDPGDRMFPGHLSGFGIMVGGHAALCRGLYRGHPLSPAC